jgi:hypothetical protein
MTQGKPSIHFGVGLKEIEDLSKRNMKTEFSEDAYFAHSFPRSSGYFS